MKTISLIICLLTVALFSSAQPTPPEVIPALQNWKGTSGTLVLPQTGKIVVEPSAKDRLWETATTLANDLEEMFQNTYTVVAGKRTKECIYLALDKPDERLGDEGYLLEIKSDVNIKSATAQGVFWGTRTLLQMMCHQPEGLQKGKATDFPSYRSRGLMLDVGRKFFSMEYLKSYVKILSFYKMNEFQIHLNDNGFVEFSGNDWNKTYSAFRLESDKFPGLTARDGSYTKAEFRDFQKMAKRYGIEVIPEIDVPAHSLAFTQYNPRLAADKKEYGMDHLDLYKKEVYQFLDTLFAEYIAGEDPVFCGPYVHIGTDEYNTKEAEQFRHFTNHYLKYISDFGKEPRVWASLKMMKGKTPVDLKGKYANIWSWDWMDLKAGLEKGYKCINTCDTYLYIVPAVNYYHNFLDTQWLYEKWSPEMTNHNIKVEKGNPNLMGAMFAVWNDRVGNGISQQDVHLRCFPALQVMAQKLWKGTDDTTPYSQFKELCRQTPEAPGVNLLAKVEGRRELTEKGQTVELLGNDSLVTTVPEIGYPYRVEFELCPDKTPAIDAILFKGPHSEFIANWNNTGKFAFRYDGYEFVFHAYKLPADTWTAIRVEGDYKGTSLFVNNKLAERLEGRTGEIYNYKWKRKDRFWYQETLIFPLQQVGDAKMGFKGKVKNIVCEQ